MKIEVIIIIVMLTFFVTSFGSKKRACGKKITVTDNAMLDVSCSVIRVNGNTYSFKYVSEAGLKVDSIKYFSEVKPSNCLDYENVLRIKKAFLSRFGYDPSKLMIINNAHDHVYFLSKNGIGLVHFRNENASVTHGCSFKALIASDTVYMNFENENETAYKKLMSDFRNKHSSAFSKKVWKKIEDDFIRGRECY